MLSTLSPAERTALRRRLTALAAATGLWSAGMGWRLLDLQVGQAERLRGLARRQQEQVVTLDARRGLLYDRSGRELAMSIEVDSVFGIPADIDDPARTAAALAPALGLEQAALPALTARLTGDRLFVWIRRKVDPAARARVEALGLKGVAFAKEHRRFYPHGDLAAHALGWVGMDNKGMDGLELALDGKVRGRDGQVYALRDARRAPFLKVARREPVPGDGVMLTLDETIQHVAQRELRAAVRETGAVAGSVVVMEPATGDVLALAAEPTFDLNRPAGAPADVRRNRMVVDAYEPGSTFKVVTMAAALEKGLIRPSDLIDCQHGAIRVAGAILHDHKSFGVLSASEVLAHSSNVGAIKIGLRLRAADFHDSMKRFGFGARTGAELPGESPGLLRDPDDWSGVSQATLSFGQEVAVTPLQLATAISAVANGGVLRPPRLVLGQTAPDGTVVTRSEPRPSKRILEQRTALILKEMMVGVVEEGTAKGARLPGYRVAGKTGTAQKIGPDGRYASGSYVASFVGFAPAEDPRLTILILLDEPDGPLFHGGDVAAPVFHRIALAALRQMGVPPERGRTLEDGGEPTLAAASHARRWVEPLPMDEKQRRAEMLREEKRRLKLERERRRTGAQDEDGPEEEIGPLEPLPLPAPETVIAGGEVLLPDLQGHALRRAVGYLGRLGLEARLVRGTVDEDEEARLAPPGVVQEQEPPAGSVVRAGSEVRLRAAPAR